MATTKKDVSLEEDGTIAQESAAGLRFERHFTRRGVSPYDSIEWEIRDAVITDEKGEKIFEQKSVEVPKSWSQMATNIVASKYFHGSLDSGERERSARQLISRVVDTMTRWGVEGKYFGSTEDAITFRFLDATGLPSRDAGHMDQLDLRLIDADHVQSQWHWYENGAARPFERIDMERAPEPR